MDRSAVDFTLLTLPSGLRLVCRTIDWPVEHFGVIVRAGSADDFPGCEGLAHFVEHTLFKGTTRRTSSAINNRMEEIGGELNAFTTKETTVVYTAFPPEYAPRAIELVGDLVSHPIFPEKEIMREQRIVDEEISSYLDAPADRVFDEFDDLIFKGSPLGHNILGTHETLRNLSREDCLRFVNTFYTPARMVAFYSGPVNPENVARLVERHFDLRADSVIATSTVVNSSPERFEIVNSGDDNYQANVVEGTLLPFSYSDPTATLSLFNNILGGPSMNSRLNMAMRERSGLVYTVESSLAVYSSITLLAIYYGCSDADRRRCHRIVEREINNLACKPLSDAALAKSKRQFAGQIAMSAAMADNVIIGAARRVLYCNHLLKQSEIVEQINGVTAAELQSLAASINLSSLTLL